MRRRSAKKRSIIPDVRFGSEIVARLIAHLMKCGKKKKAQKIVYATIDLLEKKGKERIGEEKEPLSGLAILEIAIKRVTLSVGLAKRQRRGRKFELPVPLSPERGLLWAVMQIKNVAKKKGGASIERYTNILYDCYEGKGEVVKRKQMVEKRAEAQRAFAHLA